MHNILKILFCNSYLVLMLSNLNCSPDPSETPAVTIRDSLGVRIVENIRPVWQEGKGWRLSKEPVLTITSESENHYQFYRIRGAFRLPGGRIAVGNSSSQQILFFDSSGRFEKAIGGEGGGPGELTQFMTLTRKGEDSLVVLDMMQSRVSLFDRNGSFSRSFDFDRPGRHSSQKLLSFLDGSFLLITGFTSSLDIGVTETGIRRNAHPYLRLTSYGEVLDTLAMVQGVEYMLIIKGESYHFSFGIPFGRVPVTAIHENQIFIGEGSKFEIKVYSVHGELVRIIKKEIELRITDSERAEARQYLIEARSKGHEVNRRTAEFLAALPKVQKRPAHSGLAIVDADGFLWVGNHLPFPRNYRPEIWSIFHPDGRWLGDLRTPSNFMVTDIGSDYILGVQFDENEFESVRLFEVIKD